MRTFMEHFEENRKQNKKTVIYDEIAHQKLQIIRIQARKQSNYLLVFSIK